MIRFFGTRVIAQPVECWRLVLRVQNSGRPGNFCALAEVVSFDNCSNPQECIRYPLAWDRAGAAPQTDWLHLKRNDVGELLIAEGGAVAVQSDEFDVGLIGWSDFRQQECAMLNDRRGRWNLKISVWRHHWRWFPKTIFLGVSSASFPPVVRNFNEDGRVHFADPLEGKHV